MWEITHSKPDGFYEVFERKDGDPETTHYCPGCGHGVLHKLIAEAISDLGIQDRTIIVNPVGCSVFAYYYIDAGHVQAAHGRAPAVATGIKRVRPESIVVCYQGDGDLAAIGGNEILHAANRGENITVFFVNNGIYGMTGGQMAPTTPLGEKTTTCPDGRAVLREGYPLKMCELLSTLDAPVYIERVALTAPKNHMRARKAVRHALQNQIECRGFSFVEVLSACPTCWKLTPLEAIQWVEEHMVPVFPLKVFKDMKVETVAARRLPVKDYSPEEFRSAQSESENPVRGGAISRGEMTDVAIKISGFGGQGVLFLGIALAEGGMREGVEVSWIPAYGPEMRGGTAHCHVRLAQSPIASPLISEPDVVLAFNEPSLERFDKELPPGGLLILNSSMIRHRLLRSDISALWVPATEAAKDIGNLRVANMVMLGAFLAETHALEAESVLASLSAHGFSEKIIGLNRRAIELGLTLSKTATTASKGLA